MSIDVARVRAETPGCHDRVFLHSCGSSLMPLPVCRAVTEHLECELQQGGYEAATGAARGVRRFYEAGARLLGCDPAEVAFAENATAAWNAVFYGLARTLQPGDRILTCRSEYASNYIAYLHVAGISGCEVAVVPDDTAGQVDVAALDAMIDDRTRLVSISHVPTSGGLVNPAEQIGEVTQRHGVLYLLDACQSAGQLPLDVEAIGCDALSFTGRKFLRGPRGTGLLYVRAESMQRLPPATLDLRSARWESEDRYRLAADAGRYENWENNVAGMIGLGVAMDYARNLGLEAIDARIRELAGMTRSRLADIDGIEVLDRGSRRCGIVGFRHATVEASRIRQRLEDCGVIAGTSNASSTLIDLSSRGVDSLVRFGIHYFNTEDEVDRACRAVAAAVG